MNGLGKQNAVVEFGREKGWGFRVAEGVGVITEEIYDDGWWYLPLDCTQKTRADKRIEEVKNNFKIQQVIIAHQAPLLLCPPQKTKEKPVEKTKRINVGKTALYVTGGLVAGAGVIVAAVTIAIAMMYLIVPLMMGLAIVALFGLGVLVDPVAIVVLEDGTRVEVMRWIE